ncbi:hypothetical protein [Paraliomyxa miuraensis]|uniref:hypothetical protein n=1 Tax=Paraliomyxa miuraensis TaxID=376150 RepID=UPI002252CA87|nr:hypothetical protein [Paraliomyxa miuraensis]MCX4240677.1 hypothetical protein [Paraliomyxa miuraensis]
MYAFFKLLLYLGVVAGISGFVYPRVSDHPAIANANLPPEMPRYLSFGGLGLIVIGLAGRTATKPAESETAEWK